MKLLYAEDEPAMAEAVTDILEYHNFSVDTVYNGADALAYAREEHYDGIILDVMMPKMDGFTVLRTLREGGDRTPVLLLTAKSEVEDRIAGLDLGADDYLPKPFATGELLARVRAMLRRREDYIPDILHCGDLSLNTSNAELSCGDQTVTLPKLEFKLMELLMNNQGICLSTEDMLTKVWGYETDSDIGVVWVYLSYLRKRLTALGSAVGFRSDPDTAEKICHHGDDRRDRFAAGGPRRAERVQRRFQYSSGGISPGRSGAAGCLFPAHGRSGSSASRGFRGTGTRIGHPGPSRKRRPGSFRPRTAARFSG